MKTLSTTRLTVNFTYWLALTVSFMFCKDHAVIAQTTDVVLADQVDAIQAGDADWGNVKSTDHFWYRLAPDGPYIDSQRDNKAFGFGMGKVFLSQDNGRTWPHEAIFRDADKITFSCILKNGNILFATRTRLYLSTDNLKTIKPIVVKDIDGSDYVPHTPIDPANPGWYFHPLDGVHTWDVDGSEMLVWGNYCNVLGGSVPVNIYYSTDQGETVKIAYSFGKSPKFQPPDAKPNQILGSADNSVVCRHVHCVAYNPAENAFYACTGDHDRTDSEGRNHQECHWLRGTYHATDDSWDWQVIVSVNSNSRFKSGGINFVDGQLYWASDANGKNGTMPHDRGIFRCDPADLTDKSKHTLLFNPRYESANMIIQDDVILSAHYAPASPYATGIIYSPDLGKTWAQYDLKQFGQRSGIRFHKKNSDGWFRVDLRKGWIERGEVLFIKPKPLADVAKGKADAADAIVTLDSVPDQRETIRDDEAIADTFSAKQAAIYLDRAALTWQKEKGCVTCHTNMPYLFARPVLASVQKDSGEVRQFFEKYRTERWKKKGPPQRQGFYPIVVSAGLTFNDLQTTGKLSPVARDVLDLLWTVQRDDGGWDWPDCDYAPMEIDDHYGVTLATLIIGIAPDEYAQSEKAQAGLENVRRYFKNNPPKSLHHRAMIAWCSKRIDGIASDADRAKTRDELMSLQLPDGGWSTAGFLTDWDGLERDDGEPLDTQTSDSYGTGLVMVICRELGVPADDRRMKKGVQWLRSHQRVSGKWFTRSPVNDAGNLISNTGTALAILALQSCGELPGWPLE